MAKTKMEAVAVVRIVVPFEVELVELEKEKSTHVRGVDRETFRETERAIAEHAAEVEKSRRAAAKHANKTLVDELEKVAQKLGKVESVEIEEVREA